jgi:hypothetical protein
MAKHTISLAREFNPKTKTVVEQLLSIFGTNPYYAMAKTVGGEITYQPVKQSLTVEILEAHLKGDVVLGSYQLSKDNTVTWIGWDIDSTEQKTARRYVELIVEKLRDIPHTVEYSGGKGYHVLVFLSSSMAAERAKAVVEFVRDSAGLPKTGSAHVECFPKQAALNKSTPMGSLLKIPLGLHPRTHARSKFIDMDNGWEATELDANKLLSELVAPETLETLLKENVDVNKLLVELLTPHWVAAAGSHHDLALYLSGYLSHLGWGLDSTQNLIRDIAISAGDDEVSNRVQCVTDTFKNIEQGRNVKGFSGLNDMLPGGVMRQVAELATSVITPTLVKRIDSIRLQKLVQFEKVRQVASVIWSDLTEQGEVVQTNYNQAYWYNRKTHLLISLESVNWQAILHKNYGINPTETLGRQVTEEIKLKAVSDARIVAIQNRTVWANEKLYVNLGGAAVYELDGNDITTSYNGECGYLFQTSQYSLTIEPDFASRIDCWNKLVKDLSFARSENAPSSPEEQAEMLKAWILAYFFPELLPTKPLLLALGVPGSGKTTAMRRILKVLDSQDAEVLEVVQDKPDSFRASLALHRLLVLDNLEKSGVRWLVDTLNRLATGSNIELRKLYATNEVYVIKPVCFVAMTAVNLPFSEETLFSRILPLEFQQLSTPLPEYLLQKDLSESMNGIWGDLLLKLNQIVATLKRDTTSMPPISSRLADFSVFCKRIEKSGVVDGSLLMKGLRSLIDRQRLALAGSSPFISILEQWSVSQPDEPGKWRTLEELFSVLEPMAHVRKMRWPWRQSSELNLHILAIIEPLKKMYGAELVMQSDNNFGKESYKIRFTL